MDRDGVGIGTRGEEPLAARIEIDIPRERAADRLHLDDIKPLTAFLHPIDSDGVVTTVRGIDKRSRGMHDDLGGRVEAFGGFRFLAQSWGRGEELGAAGRGIPREDRSGEAQFVEKVDEFAILRELEVARSAAGDGGREAVFRDGGFVRVDRVDDDAVHSEIGDEGEFPVGRETAVMWMGRILTSLNDLRAALVFGDGGGAGFARPIEGQERGRAAAVLGGEEEFAGGMHREMGRAAVAGGYEVEELERSVGSDLVGGDSADIFLRGGGVELLPIGREGEEAGRTDLVGEFGGSEGAFFGVESGVVDPLGPRASRAEVDVAVLGGERRGESEEREGEKGRFFHEAQTMAQAMNRRIRRMRVMRDQRRGVPRPRNGDVRGQRSARSGPRTA